MDDTYFDFLGGDETLMGHVFGIILFPVLFPLYLSLKLLTGAIELLEEVLSYAVEGFKTALKKGKNDEIAMKVASISNKEQIEAKLTELKEQKKQIEEQIKKQNQEPVNYSPVETPTLESEIVKEDSESFILRLK